MPDEGDIVEVPCVQCGKPVRLMWTKSCIGWGIMHGTCRPAYLAQQNPITEGGEGE